MAIDFPDTPAINDTHTVGNITWTWDGTAWRVLSSTGGGGAVTNKFITAPPPPVLLRTLQAVQAEAELL